MRIDSPIMTNAQVTGSFSGSFTGVGNFEGLTADSVAYENVTGKPTLVSGSEQIVISDTDGYTAFSSSLAVDIAANATAIGNLDGSYATDAELNASSSALTLAYGAADTTLSSSLAIDIASNKGAIQTEKGRIDAILSASNADADSFKEIVDLINSVDTDNDAAFASYVTASNGRFASLESKSGSLESDISDLQTDSGSFSSRITSVEGDLADLGNTYATDAELNASSSALTINYTNADSALSSSLSTAIASEYTAADSSLSSSLADDIASNLSAIGTLQTNSATKAELNASSSALINGYETADTTLSASLAADIAAIDTEVPAIIDNGGTPAYNTGITKAEVLSILNVEDGADVTDTDNVTAAGALMDSEVSSLSGIKTLTVPDSTTISSFGASLVDDADASAARTTLGVDPAGTDNSTDVTLANTNYLSLSGQELTGGTVPVGSGGTGATTAAAARTNLGVDPAGTDNSIDVTLAGSYDYITIDGQTITRNQIDLSTDVTGVLPVGNMSATALTTVQTASSQAAQLALTAQEGDVVVRTDENKTYMHNGGTAGTMADYTLLATPTDAVTSVNGNTGAVTVVENVTTNLSTTANGTSLVINSSDGTNASIPAATTTAWGAMTDEDKTKLNGIEANADVTDTTNVVAALTAGTNITIAANGTISSTDTDTVYTHPTHPGDDIDIDTGALTGATVISDLDFNVTTDTLGHVTDANATIATRTLTAGDLGLGSSDNVTFTEVSSSGASEFAGGAAIGMNRHSSNPFGGNYGYLQLKDSMGIFSSTDNDKMHGFIDADATNGLRLRGSKSGTFGTYGLVLDYGGGYSFEGSMDGVIDDVVHIDGFPATFEVGNSNWYASGSKPSVTFYSSINVKDDVVAYHSSDERFKDNIIEIDSSLEKVESLRGVYFDWNDKQDIYEGHDIGVIAQEVEEVLPEIVETREDGYKAVKYEKLTAVLIQAVKELSARVKELENK